MIEYKSKHIKGYLGRKVMIHESFLTDILAMEDVLRELGFVFWVTGSFRLNDQKLQGAIVDPAKRSNHLVANALDGNLQEIKTGEWFNSKKMGDGTGSDQNVIERLEKAGLRWGGRLKKNDEVHFDSGLNLKNQEKWQEIYNEIQ